MKASDFFKNDLAMAWACAAMNAGSAAIWAAHQQSVGAKVAVAIFIAAALLGAARLIFALRNEEASPSPSNERAG